jgi:hypothetical protein
MPVPKYSPIQIRGPGPAGPGRRWQPDWESLGNLRLQVELLEIGGVRSPGLGLGNCDLKASSSQSHGPPSRLGRSGRRQISHSNLPAITAAQPALSLRLSSQVQPLRLYRDLDRDRVSLNLECQLEQSTGCSLRDIEAAPASEPSL